MLGANVPLAIFLPVESINQKSFGEPLLARRDCGGDPKMTNRCCAQEQLGFGITW